MKTKFTDTWEESEELYEPERVSCVNVSGEWVPLSEVKFIDISEDLEGLDLITFEHEGKKYHSRVIQKFQ
jgi:hypothetical protein